VTGAFLAGAVAGYAIAIPVGVIAVLILETGIRHGFRPAAAAGAGAATADGIYATVAMVGGSAVAAVIDPVDEAFRVIAAGVLLAIGIRGLLLAGRAVGSAAGRGDPVRAARGTYLRFLAITLLNPVTVVYFGALIVGLPSLAPEAPERAAFIAGAFLSSLSWQLGLAAVAALAHRRLPRGFQAGLSIVGNLVIIGLAVAIASGTLGG
jgi:threonine/homoserine/homoserine lactone efflux protein